MNIDKKTYFNNELLLSELSKQNDIQLCIEWKKRLMHLYFSPAAILLNDDTKKDQFSYAATILVLCGVDAFGNGLDGYKKSDNQSTFKNALEKLGIIDEYVHILWAHYRNGMIHAGDTGPAYEELFLISNEIKSAFSYDDKKYTFTVNPKILCKLIKDELNIFFRELKENASLRKTIYQNLKTRYVDNTHIV